MAWSPPPPAVTLEQQRDAREGEHRIVLARVVEVRQPTGVSVQYFDWVVSLDDYANTYGAEMVVHRTMCGERYQAGQLVLLYYQPVEVRWADATGEPEAWKEDRLRLVVSLGRNADPDIGPLLRGAAYRLHLRIDGIAERRANAPAWDRAGR